MRGKGKRGGRIRRVGKGSSGGQWAIRGMWREPTAFLSRF